MDRVRIRGIYSTALTRLLQQQDFQIVQPSTKIQTRLRMKPSYEPFELEVRPTEDRQGVLAVGTASAVDHLMRVLRENLPDVITRRPSASLQSIFVGIAQSARPSGYLIDLGCDIGFLPKTQTARPLRSGQAVLVQVSELASAGKPLILTAEISLPGRRAVLSSAGGVKVSQGIADPAERERLLRLGSRHLPSGWGLIWRTAACRCAEAELVGELRRLQDQIEFLTDHPENGIPGLLLEFTATAQFEFPGGAKAHLDRIRHEVTPTLFGHHKCKAYSTHRTMSRVEARLLAVLDHAPSELPSTDPILGSPVAGQLFFIEHIKADAEPIMMRRGRVMVADPQTKTVQIRREIGGRGIYDGLGSAREPGDYALTELREGSWEYRTFYYSADGRLKGIYANINTPIEIYSDRARYVDLEIDVARAAGGTVRLIDETELEAILAAGFVSEQLTARAREVAGHLVAELTRHPSL
jgi:Ribonuclease G/E